MWIYVYKDFLIESFGQLFWYCFFFRHLISPIAIILSEEESISLKADLSFSTIGFHQFTTRWFFLPPVYIFYKHLPHHHHLFGVFMAKRGRGSNVMYSRCNLVMPIFVFSWIRCCFCEFRAQTSVKWKIWSKYRHAISRIFLWNGSYTYKIVYLLKIYGWRSKI